MNLPYFCKNRDVWCKLELPHWCISRIYLQYMVFSRYKKSNVYACTRQFSHYRGKFFRVLLMSWAPVVFDFRGWGLQQRKWGLLLKLRRMTHQYGQRHRIMTTSCLWGCTLQSAWNKKTWNVLWHLGNSSIKLRNYSLMVRWSY